MPPTRRQFLAAGLPLAATLPLLAACSGPTGGRPSAASSGSGAFPVAVAHKYGTTTVRSAPKRVVSVGFVEQDALLALGVVPVALTYWFGEAPNQIFPWATAALGSATPPVVLRDTDGVQVERIAALRPDLILGLYSGLTRKDYDTLSKIAPVVAQPKGVLDFGVRWQDLTLTVGRAVGREQRARRVVAGVEARIREEAAAHPAFAGRSAAVVTAYEGLFVYGPEDPRGRTLRSLGFTFPPALLRGRTHQFGWSVSAERTSELADLDVVVWLDRDKAPSGMASIFERSRAYREGRTVDIATADGAFSVAQSMVTPLSIPYVLDRYVPMLAAAVDGDPATKSPAA